MKSQKRGLRFILKRTFNEKTRLVNEKKKLIKDADALDDTSERYFNNRESKFRQRKISNVRLNDKWEVLKSDAT